MPIIANVVGRLAIWAGGLFGLSWAGETLAKKIGRLVSYAWIFFAGLVAISPSFFLKFIKIIPKSSYTSAKWVIVISGLLVAVYQFMPTLVANTRDALGYGKKWYEFWK